MTSALRRLAPALLLLLATTACGSDDGGAKAAEPDPAPTSAATSAPTSDVTGAPTSAGLADPDARLDFAVVETATADLTSDNPSCAVVKWSPNETGAPSQVDFRQLDCYGDQDAVDIGLPALLQTIIWVEMPSADEARAYAQDNLYEDKQALVAGPTALVVNGLWGERGTALYAEVQAACGCGELVSAAS
ncbi:hypothetical protein [Nocardioides daeguensis]|uniref:DUF3558 domain-containing protein n=1 Tax=Nocardioides daeguensis TaxID=908359 RepID=A0ABP6V4F4_9ACTN|nr:hypothetical protein [Nocardioides daeguensis]MBV6726437.1 hypothetical protein [Nocardioides daeguensis]MCR1772280.1 hypothetical protein [Nocardioides daeguensis]